MLTNAKAEGIRYIEIFCIENKAKIWGQKPQPTEAVGGLGADPPTLRQFYSFFPKNMHFLGKVWPKFRVFKLLNKVLMRPQGFFPGARAPACPPYYANGRKSKDSTFAIVTLL